MAANVTPLRYDRIKTPDPGQHVLVTYHPKSKLTRAAMPAVGSTYRALPTTLGRWENLITEGYGDYTFTQFDEHGAPPSPDTQEPQTACYWCRPYSAAELANPVPYRISSGSRLYSWPPVLEKIELKPDPLFFNQAAFVFNSAYAPVLRIRKKLRPQTDHQSTTRIYEYLSPQPFPEAMFRKRQPQPQAVEWDSQGGSGSLICLHDDILVPAFNATQTFGSVAGGVYAMTQAATPRRKFRATNFIGWRSFFIDPGSPTFQDSLGLFYLRQEEILPPPQLEIEQWG
jgi:hypothetical protein